MDDLDLNEIILKNRSYKNSIEFTDYCMGKMEKRNIDKKLVLETIESKSLKFAGKQKIMHKGELEIRYKLIYKISSKYSLIIIVSYEEKILKVINVIKTSKRAEKLWRKKFLK